MPPWVSPRGEKDAKRAFTDAELLSVLEHMAEYSRGRYLMLTLLMIQTASRVTETLSLRVEDIALAEDAAEVTFRATKTRVVRRGLIQRELGVKLLAAARKGFLFPKRDGSGPMPSNNYWQAMRKWVVKHGHQGDLDVHSIRRWGAGRLHAQRVPVEVAKLVTGHEDSKTYLDYASRSRYEVLEASQLLWTISPMAPQSAPHADCEACRLASKPSESGDSENLAPCGGSTTSLLLPLGALADPARMRTQSVPMQLREALATRPSCTNTVVEVLRGLGPRDRS